MRMKLAVLGAAFAAAGLGGAAQAEGWSVLEMRDRSDAGGCMPHARATLESYMRSYSVAPTAEIVQTEWTTGGYDFEGPETDAIIICPAESGGGLPYLVVYSTLDESLRIQVAERLENLWNGGAAASTGGKAAR